MKKAPVILIADDIVQTVHLVALSLTSNLDCEILTASSGKETLDITFERHPDLIILDIALLGMDGFSVCKAINARKGYQDIPIIFLSGKVNNQDIVMGLNLGAVDFVTKPFYPKELVARVKIHLKIQSQQRLIRQQNQRNRELLQVLCHDLLNPIGALSGIMRLSSDHPDILQESQEYMKDSVDNMVEMISLVREFKAIDDGDIEVQLVSIDLNEAIATSLQILNYRLTEKEITTRVSVPEGLTVLAERTSLINSVINNLITNAIKFSFKGSEILIEAKELNDDQVVLTIEDCGIGIPHDILKDLFSMNASTSRMGTSNETGTGYGLPLVKKFVSLYKGDISVESIEKTANIKDHGTKIILTLAKG